MRRDSDRGEDKGHVMSEAETTALQLETKEHKGRLVNTEVRRKDCPLDPPGRARPCQHLDLGPVASRTGIQ